MNISLLDMPKFTRQPEARPEAILDSAINHFLGSGFADVTMAQIAKGANITAGTIYRYFDSKDALVGALVQRHIDTSWSRGADISEAYRSKTPREVVALLLHRWIDHLARDRSADVLLLVIREAPRFPSQVEEYATQLLQSGCTAIERALRHGIEGGEFSTTLEIEATAQALAAGILKQLVWQRTFGPYLSSPPPGVDPVRLGVDAMVRGLPRAGESVMPAPKPEVVAPAIGVTRQAGLRITTLKPPPAEI